MGRCRAGVLCGGVAVLAALAGLLCSGVSAGTTGLPACRLDVSTTQICPTSFRATAGKSATVVVARYEDHSHCNFAPPANYPGDNGNYIVASVSINWGDRTPATSGVAHKGSGCPGTSVSNSKGATEPITGIHRYKKSGTYAVLVSITYVRGSGDTYKNCARQTRGDTVYNALTNCIALKSPAHSIAVVRKP